LKKPIVLAACLAGDTLFAQDMSFGEPGKNIYRELPNPGMAPMNGMFDRFYNIYI